MLPCTALSNLLAAIILLILVQPRQGRIRSENVISDALELETSNVVLLPINALGLANRLRIMSSLYAISQSQNTTLLVVWGQREDCNSSFADLFHTIGRYVQVISLPEQDSVHGVFESLVRSAVRRASIAKNASAQEHYLRDFVVNADMHAAINIVWTRGTHAPHGASCGDYLYAKSSFYRLLTPSAAVMRLVDSVGAQLQNSGGFVAGVHVRAFDTQYDWPVVSPSLFAGSITSTESGPSAQYQSSANQGDVVQNLQSKRFDEASSLDAFVQLMAGLIHTNPSIRFFLASNSATAKHIIQSRFGSERILVLDSADIGLRGTSSGIIVAAAEFFLLGETAFVVHSRGSSFAREAASRRLLPVVDVSVVCSVFDCDIL